MKNYFFPYILLFGMFSTLLVGCKKDKKDNDKPTSVDQSAFLTNSTAIILDSYSDYIQELDKLQADVDSFAELPLSNQLMKARTSLKATHKAWQRVNFLEFGPAENASLKSNLNIHPTDTSKIEYNISTASYDLSILSNKTAKGFPALDYLLNSKSDSITLAAFNQDSSRINYLISIMDDISSRSKQVFNEWDSYKNEFSNNLGTNVGSSTAMLVNSLNQHYERFFRDNKIGIPLGIRSSGIQRLEMVEAYYGQYSLELAVENFTYMQKFYMGIDKNENNGYGLDDYLVESNAAELNNNIQSQMQVIDSKLKNLNDPLTEQIANQPSLVKEVYDEIQKLIILWKVDMPSRMGILITYQDNDGD